MLTRAVLMTPSHSEGQQTSNSYLDFLHQFRSQFLISTDKAVDTFFLISGILMAYTTINKLRKGKQSFAGALGKTGLFTLLRFFRLVPLYGTVLFTYATILPHMGEGPVWYKMIEETARYATHVLRSLRTLAARRNTAARD